MQELTVQIEEDRATLEELMGHLEVGRDRLKSAVAWSAEKLGRLKLNGRVWGHSPLSPMIELEALYIGITGKRQLWVALQGVFGPRLEEFDFEELIQRADDQRDGVERHRLDAARGALRRD
jgi:hypothetical protein